jgi:hypothetical protein
MELLWIGLAAAVVGGAVYLFARKKEGRPSASVELKHEPAPQPPPVVVVQPPAVPASPMPAQAASPIEIVTLNGRAANNGYVEPLPLSVGRHDLLLQVTSSPHPDPVEREKARESVRLAGFDLRLPAVVEARIALRQRKPNTFNADGTVKYWSEKFGSDYARLVHDEDGHRVLQGEVGFEPEPEQQDEVHVVYVLSWVSDLTSTIEIKVPVEITSTPPEGVRIIVDFSVQRMHAPRRSLGGRMEIQSG